MAVIQRRKRSRKSTYKNTPYPTKEQKNAHSSTTFSFGPTFKSSNLGNNQNTINDSHSIFQFPIPKVDPVKATMMNDEVDIYFPRKHFLTKYQMLNDLVENIVIKPIPTDKIIPPRLFPIAFVEGMPYEKKKAELLRNLKKEPKIELKTEPKTQVTEKINDEKISIDNKDNIGKTKSEKNEEKDIDENLSDYDPDFDDTPVSGPDETEESKIIDDYLNSRKNIKERTDFLFGDLGTMKMQENSLNELENTLKEELNKSPDVGERFKYNIKHIDDLHNSFLKFTAKSIDGLDAELNEIESNIGKKFNIKFTDKNQIKQFKTNMFDTIKVGISLDEYNNKYKKQKQNINSITHSNSKDYEIPQNEQQNIFANNVSTLNTSDSLINGTKDIGQASTLLSNQQTNSIIDSKQEVQPHISQTIPVIPQSQLPPTSDFGTATMTNNIDNNNIDKNENNINVDNDDDISKKQSSDLNQFDFDNDMLYESADFNNQNNDNDNDDFGSLGNEVFLNM